MEIDELILLCAFLVATLLALAAQLAYEDRRAVAWFLMMAAEVLFIAAWFFLGGKESFLDALSMHSGHEVSR